MELHFFFRSKTHERKCYFSRVVFRDAQSPWSARQSHSMKGTPGRPRKWGGREKQLASLPHSSGPPRPLPTGNRFQAHRPGGLRGSTWTLSLLARGHRTHTAIQSHAHPAQPKRQTTARPMRRPLPVSASPGRPGCSQHWPTLHAGYRLLRR